MMRDVDKSDVIGSNLIQSDVLGPIPLHYLSEGVKTLILTNNDKMIYNQYEFLLYVIDKGKPQMRPNLYNNGGDL